MHTESDLPAVAAIVPTRDRPVLVERAVSAILNQDYAGHIQCVVVFDQSKAHELDVAVPPNRELLLVTNERTPGLAGARNTGVLASHGELVSFCDDDDEWLQGKITAQVRLLASRPDVPVVASGILINFGGRDRPRLPPDRELGFTDFLRDRIMEVNPCTLVVRRAALIDQIGLVDEQIPGAYGEDYEWLLRASRTGPILSVQEPLVRITWHTSSFFTERWRTIIDALSYLIQHYPEFQDEPRGLARLEGQLAVAHAGLGDRRGARTLAWSALRRDWRNQRAIVALLASSGLVPVAAVTRLAHRFGRGI